MTFYPHFEGANFRKFIDIKKQMFRTISMQNLETITDRLFYDFPSKKTQVAVVFGAKSISGELARSVARDFFWHGFNDIILTGGARVFEPHVLAALTPNFMWWSQPQLHADALGDFVSLKREADYMRDILIAEGVPERHIIMTDRTSKNTGENVANIKSMLREFNDASLYTVAYQQRRAMGTIRFDPDMDHVDLVSAPVYPFGFTRDNWQDTAIAGIVELENSRVIDNDPNSYIGQFCEDPDIAHERERVAHLPDFKMRQP